MKKLFEIWHQHMNEEVGEEDMDRREASKVMIIDDDKVLVLKRSPDSHWKPLYWDFPGGHLQNNETYEEAAIRETKEETNLDISNLEKIKTKNQEKRVDFFKTSDFLGKIELDKEENTEYMWLKLKNISNYNKLTPKVRELMKQEMNK